MNNGTYKNPQLKEEIFASLGLTDGRTKEGKEEKRKKLTPIERFGFRVNSNSKGGFHLIVLNPEAPPGKPKGMYLKKFDSRSEARKVGKKVAELLKKKYGLNFEADSK